MKILLLLVSFSALGQVLNILPFSTNQEPGNFSYIENEYVKVIFKEGYSKRAFRVLDTITSHYENISSRFPIKPKKVSIILRNKNRVSNGFVRFAPFKSEFYDFPYRQGELDGGEWLELLGIHEYRHVAQLSQSFSGINEAAYVLLGEFGVSLLTIWSTPIWVLEGDATIAETQFSHAGRGRNSSFSRRFRALLVGKNKLNYEKLYFNSPYERIPDFYKFGYYFLIYLKDQYNFDVEKNLKKVTSSSYNPFAYQNLIIKHTGKKIDILIEEFVDFYKKRWNRDTSESGNVLSSKTKYNTDYLYPTKFKEKIIALKFGIKNVPEFVMIKDDKEKHLHFPDSIHTRHLNSDETTIYWIENRIHYRFSTLSHNVICSINIKTEKQKCIKKSGDETSYDKLGRLETSSIFDKTSSIVVFEDGKQIFENVAKDYDIFINPQFIDNNRIFYIHKNSSGEFSLVTIDFRKKVKKVHLVSKKAIRRARYFNKEIYFEWEKNEIEEIYKINLSSPVLAKLTQSKIAAIYPEPTNDGLLFSRMTSNGLKLVSLPKNSEQYSLKGNDAKTYIVPKGESKVLAVSTQAHEPKEFSDNYFNFHSWVLLPPLFTPSFTLSAMSDNITETIGIQTGLAYLDTEKTGGAFGVVTLKKYVIPFDIGVDHFKRFSDINGREFNWNETSFYAGPKFIHRSNWGRWYQSINLGVYLNQVEISDRRSLFSDEFSNGTLQGGMTRIGYSISSNKNSVRPFPDYALSAIYTYRQIQNYDNDERGLFSNLNVDSTIGLFDIFSLRARYVKEVQYEREYRFASEVIQARGYNLSFSPDIESYKLDFSMPIMGLQYNLATWIHFNKFEFGVFFDRMQYQDMLLTDKRKFHSSYGVELISNLFLFRTLPAPIGIGVRSYYKNSPIEEERGSAGEVFLSSSVAF